MAKKTTSSKAGSAAKSKDKTKPATKNQILQGIADSTQLSKKQVSDVLEAMTEMIKKDLSKKGPGVFTIPGLLKLRRAEKPATKARKGINPRTGEEITIAAKPKQTVVRARVLKSLQEMVKK